MFKLLIHVIFFLHPSLSLNGLKFPYFLNYTNAWLKSVFNGFLFQTIQAFDKYNFIFHRVHIEIIYLGRSTFCDPML